jgi:hypothetical protein
VILFQSLIAMMANTYETTNEHDREWIRQVREILWGPCFFCDRSGHSK